MDDFPAVYSDTDAGLLLNEGNDTPHLSQTYSFRAGHDRHNLRHPPRKFPSSCNLLSFHLGYSKCWRITYQNYRTIN